jgi:hypothetical protein
MSEQETTNEALRTALRELHAQWQAQSHEADIQGRRLSVGNMQQAFYQRGIAEGLRLALADIQQLLAVGETSAPTETSFEINYAVVSREIAAGILAQAGMTVGELHEHSDHSFSAILPPLQALSFEGRIDKLNSIADVVILAQGRLPNSNKAYIDFAFSKHPTT